MPSRSPVNEAERSGHRECKYVFEICHATRAVILHCIRQCIIIDTTKCKLINFGPVNMSGVILKFPAGTVLKSLVSLRYERVRRLKIHELLISRKMPPGRRVRSRARNTRARL